MVAAISAAQLGMTSEPEETDAEPSVVEGRPLDSSTDVRSPQQDYFVNRDGLVYAGTHLLIDLWGARNLDDIAVIETAMRDSVTACGATLLHLHLHQFSPNGGLSGVAVLAESHISVHTWPERGYAAFDIFMCGSCNPYAAIEVLKGALEPERIQLAEQKRGLGE